MKAEARVLVFLSVMLVVLAPLPAVADDGPRVERDPLAVRDWAVDFSKMERSDSRSFAPQPNAVPSAASHFITMVPCRVFDTRNPVGAYGGPKFVENEIRSFNIPAGPCAGIPANASAFSVNLTVHEPEEKGWLTAWPTGSTQPLASSLNYHLAQTAANGIVVPAGTGGSIDIYARRATHVILDINGYFVEGVVTDITAGDGLSGGGTGSVTLDIEPGSVTLDMLDTTGSSAGDVLISDGDDATWGSLSGFALLAGTNVFTGSNTFNLGLSANGQKITGVATPTDGTDAANKAYVDAAVSGGGGGGALILVGSTGTQQLNNGSTEYIAAGMVMVNSTESNVAIPLPLGGVVSNLQVKLDGSPGTGDSYALTVMRNGAAVATFTCTISTSATTCADTDATVWTAGDTISLRSVPSGGPSQRRLAWSVTIQ